MTPKKAIETLPVCLECDGLTTRDFSAPPFRVEAGQSVCLHVLLRSPAWHEDVMPILTGRIAHPALHLHGSAIYLERPMPRRRWWGGWHNPSITDWLTTEKGLTSEEAMAVISRVEEPADLSVGRLGWNERTMLALEACLIRPPDLLVFDTCGNDWETAYRTFDRLASRQPHFALVYLKTRFEREDPCLPGAVCLDVVRAGTLATIAE